MSDIAAASDAISRIRKERVHTTMLIELLALLVFMAMAFAFVMRDEGSRTNPWKEKAEHLEQELGQEQKLVRELRAQVFSLRRQIETLESAINQLVAQHQGTLQAADWITVRKADLARAADQASNAHAIAEELREENQRLRAALQAAHGKGGTDLPNCPVTAGFLLSVDLYGDGSFRVAPAWRPGAADAARAVPGVTELVGGASDHARFAAAAGQISRWGRSQPEPCGFRVKVSEHHGDLALYKRQVGLVEQFFYVRKN